MMKRLLTYIVLMLAVSHVFAQQTPLYSMYMFNELSYNPAVAGRNDYCEAQVNNRYQFVGIENAPVTATITLTGKLRQHPMGWGGMIYNDSQGAFSKFGVYGVYSYKMNVGKQSSLSFGLNAGLVKYAVDMTKIRFLQDEENLTEYMYTSIRPDASFGMYFNARKFFVGLSLDQLLNNKIEVYNDTLAVDNTLNRFKSHFNLMGGYRYKISNSLLSESSVVVRKVTASPFQFELSSRVTYREVIWGGMSFRTGDAIVLFVGYTFRDLLSFGYSYDITYSGLRKASHGAHEVFLSVKFKQKD